MRIRVAKDRRTGFPCIRLEEPGVADIDGWIALLPVTKAQVEQWVFTGGLDGEPAPELVTDLIERLEHIERCDNATPRSVYPERVRMLVRVPPRALKSAFPAAATATNLSLWADDAELHDKQIRFPTAKSEWGRMLTWLAGRIPTSKEWRQLVDYFAVVRSKDLLQAVLQEEREFDPSVVALLRGVGEALGEDQRGLPLMNDGTLELVSETDRSIVLTTKQETCFYRPMVAGDSRIWPALAAADASPWRPVLQATLPVVGIRPLYRNVDSWGNGEVKVPSSGRGTSTAPPTASQGTGAPPSRRGHYVRTATMKCRCPLCYQEIPADVIGKGDRAVWCWQTATAGGSSGLSGAGATSATPTFEHKNTKPARGSAIARFEAVALPYLDACYTQPERIRSTTVAGYTQTGKTTWLLSLTGLLYYPGARPALLRALPPGFHIGVALTAGLHEQGGVNLAAEMEKMWLLGAVPARTPDLRRALRYPMNFTRSRDSILPMLRRQQRLIVVLNDIAGEVTDDAARLVNDEDFPHVACSTDVVYIVPADRLEDYAKLLELFYNALGGASYKGKALNPSGINLILAISKIDLLKHGSPTDRELLSLALQQPYQLPDEFDPAKLKRYLETMNRLDSDIHAFLEKHCPQLAAQASRFASVRYSAFSSFGFEPIRRGMLPNSDSSLPFKPEPVRVADPILWLLQENGLLSV